MGKIKKIKHDCDLKCWLVEGIFTLFPTDVNILVLIKEEMSFDLRMLDYHFLQIIMSKVGAAFVDSMWLHFGKSNHIITTGIQAEWNLFFWRKCKSFDMKSTDGDFFANDV